MLFNESEQQDLNAVLASVDAFSEAWGLGSLAIDVEAVTSTLRGMRQDFPAQGGSAMASPFKKTANFLCYFVAERPIRNSFPTDVIGQELAAVRGHQNAMVGLHIVFDALHEATIIRSDGTVVALEERVAISRHSYCDLVQACSTLTPQNHFHLVANLLEQIVYRSNPNASYPIYPL